MTRMTAVAGAMLAACAGATAAAAQATSTPRAGAAAAAIDTLAREWSTGLGTPRCERQADWKGGGMQCTWGRAPANDAPWVQHTPAEVRGAPAVVMWNRLATSSAHARRMLDSLDAALVARGATRRSCGTGDVPAGQVTGTLWEGAAITVLASRIDEPRGTARTYVVATDQPGVLSLDVLCPRAEAVTRRTDTTRVHVADPEGMVFHPASVVQVVTVMQAGDSALTIVEHRTGRPVADSAEVRRALVATLARPGILDDEPWLWSGAGPGTNVGWLVVRHCWTDVCSRLEPERTIAIRPGDLVFVRQPDRSWKPQR